MSSSGKGTGPNTRLPMSRIGRPNTASGRSAGMVISGSRSNAQSPEPIVAPPKPSDTFIIGDRVWVSGTKPGTIAFIGETKFSEGEWAGIVLDEATGKNDGTVQGICYFQCPPKRGLFTRPSNLRREPKPLHGSGDFSDGTASELGSFVSPPTSIADEVVGPHGDVTISPEPSNNNSGTTGASSANVAVTGDFRVGDRVVVLSGQRLGTLRYLGATEFAKGSWAGVELDEPTGKNDGSVAGKRYFACKPSYGLFAPLHKVAKPGSAAAIAGATSAAASRLTSGARKTPGSLSKTSNAVRSRSGSQESVSSVGSNFSSASRTRVKLGVTALSTNQRSNNNVGGRQSAPSSTPRRSSTSQLSSSTSKTISITALQKVLREKEEHIDQLLKERDLERTELVRASAQADKAEARRSEAEMERAHLLAEYAARLETLEAKLQDSERERAALQLKFDDEKRKVEELQFEMEEENIDKSTLETKTEEDESKIFELEEALSNEKERALVSEEKAKQLKELYDNEKVKSKEAEESAVMYLEQIEALQSRLSTVDQLQARERSESDMFKNQLDDKDSKIRDMSERLDGLERQLKEAQRNLSDVTEENNNLIKRRANLDSQLSDLTTRLGEAEALQGTAEEQARANGSKVNELEAELAAAVARAESLTTAKESLQAQIDGADAAASGSENEQQAAMNALREQMRERESALATAEEARSRLELRTKQLEGQLKEESDRRTEELSAQAKRFEMQNQALQTKVEESDADLASLKSRLTHAAQSHREELEAERSAAAAKAEDLMRQLGGAEAELSATRAQVEDARAKEEEANARVDEVAREKSRLELSLRTAEADRADLIQAKRAAVEDRERLASNVLSAEEEMGKSRELLESLTKERDRAFAEKIEAMKTATELKAKSDEVHMRTDCLQKEKNDLEAKVAAMTEELARQSASADSAAQERIAALTSEITAANQSLGELRAVNSKMESEHQSLVSEIAKLKSIMEEKTKLQRERDELQGMLKEMRTKYAHLESVNSRAQVQLSDVADEMKKSRDQLIALTREHEALKGKHRMSLESKEKDRRRLEDRIRALEQKIKDESIEESSRRISESRENAERQIDFLNSVIVELQNKNTSLQKELQLLSGDGLEFQNNGHSEIIPAPHEISLAAHVSSRAYCDICEEFDLHDTEDCPKQMSSSDISISTRHHGDRNATRPYCDTCEVFGHWTEDCEDDVTF